MGSAHHLAKAGKTLPRRAWWTHDQPTPWSSKRTGIAASFDWRNGAHPGDDCVDVAVGRSSPKWGPCAQKLHLSGAGMDGRYVGICSRRLVHWRPVLVHRGGTLPPSQATAPQAPPADTA